MHKMNRYKPKDVTSPVGTTDVSSTRVGRPKIRKRAALLFAAILACGVLGMLPTTAQAWFGCNSGWCGFGGHGGHHLALQAAPRGSFVHKFIAVQANKAEPLDFVFYGNEWYKGGTTLGPYGRYHVGEVAKRLPKVPFPVVLEPHINPAVNEARRKLLVEALLNLGISDAQQRVVIAYPPSEDLRGDDIERLIVNRTQQLYGQNFFNGFRGFGFGGFGGRGLFGGFGYGGLGLGGSGFGRFGGFGFNRPLFPGF